MCRYPVMLCPSSHCVATSSCPDASLPHLLGRHLPLGPMLLTLHAACWTCLQLSVPSRLTCVQSRVSTQILTCMQAPQQPSDGANGAEANGADTDGADDELANFVENTWNPRNPYSVRLDLPQTLLNR